MNRQFLIMALIFLLAILDSVTLVGADSSAARDIDTNQTRYRTIKVQNLEGAYSRERQTAGRFHHFRRGSMAIYPWGAEQDGHQPGQLECGPAPPGPKRQPRYSTGPVLRLPEQYSPLPGLAGLFSQTSTPYTDRMGQKRCYLSGQSLWYFQK